MGWPDRHERYVATYRSSGSGQGRSTWPCFQPSAQASGHSTAVPRRRARSRRGQRRSGGRSVVGPCVVLGLAHDKLVAVELGVGPLESADLGTTAVAASGFDVRLRSERLNEWVKPGLVLVGMDGDRQLMACRVVVQVEEGAAFPFDLKCAREQLDGDVIGKTDGEVGGPCSMLCTVALSSR